MTARPIGDPDAVTAPWWDATRDKRLVVQRCTSCGRHQHYPRALCVHCGATGLEFGPASGRGVVHSFTVVHRPPSEAFTVPYVVALVDLDEGVRMLTHIVGCPPADVRFEMKVRVEWEPLDDGRHLPVFRPEED